jgi:hypothetical protein
MNHVPPDPRKERIARNESAFRALNESLGMHVHRDLRRGGDYSGFVCECAHEECGEVVSVGLDKYEQVRSDPTHFLLKPGHEIADAEDVIESGEGYAIVRKHAELAEYVEITDPRS